MSEVYLTIMYDTAAGIPHAWGTSCHMLLISMEILGNISTHRAGLEAAKASGVAGPGAVACCLGPGLQWHAPIAQRLVELQIGMSDCISYRPSSIVLS
jgi:hypothetical protein